MTKPPDFWSRRKAAVAEADAAEAKAQARADAAEEQSRLEEKTDAEILGDLGLRDPDELQPGDDFAAFLKAAVPDRIRRRALRRLWLSNPVLANLDSLVDYGEDYTDAATVVENLQSAIQLGRGALARAEEQIAAISGDEASDAAVRPPETDRFASETVGAETCDTLVLRHAPEPQEAESRAEPESDTRPDVAGCEPESDQPAPRPRRMKFHFSD